MCQRELKSLRPISMPLKRGIGESQYGPAQKRRCVRFSGTSTCRILQYSDAYECVEGCNGEKEAVQSLRFDSVEGGDSLNILAGANILLPASSDQCNLIVGNAQKDAIESFNCEVVQNDCWDIILSTKQSDGPALDALITQDLIVQMVEKKKINNLQVSNILRSYDQIPVLSDADNTETSFESADDRKNDNNLFEPSMPPYLTNQGSFSDQETSALATEEGKIGLYRTVHERLLKLTNRVKENGRAALLPSTVVMGSAFVPGLEFLIKAVSEEIRRSIENQTPVLPNEKASQQEERSDHTNLKASILGQRIDKSTHKQVGYGMEQALIGA